MRYMKLEEVEARMIWIAQRTIRLMSLMNPSIQYSWVTEPNWKKPERLIAIMKANKSQGYDILMEYEELIREEEKLEPLRKELQTKLREEREELRKRTEVTLEEVYLEEN